MHAHDGRRAEAGNTLRFSALARALDGGDSDPEQSKATYYPVGFSSLIKCDGHGQGFGFCASQDAISPPYRFYSENPEIADFAMPNYAVGETFPLRDKQHAVVRDATGRFGLLCTFKTGDAFINVESGFQRARMKIHVDGGFGPCVDKPVPQPVLPEPVVKPRPVVEPDAPEPPPLRFRPNAQPPQVLVFPPLPVPVVAPAPPGAPGVGRKEEHEVQPESEGDRGGHRSVAVRRVRRASPVDQAWPMLGAISLMSFMGAAAAAELRRRRSWNLAKQDSYARRRMQNR
jgi:hypothetical protein